jgi:hypothetical protein
MNRIYYLPALLFSLAVFSCQAQNKSFDNLPINHIQTIGSHNSYKQAIAPDLFKLIKKRDSVHAMQLQYSHICLSGQLDLGLRNLEIDVYADPHGEEFAYPKGLKLALSFKNEKYIRVDPLFLL